MDATVPSAGAIATGESLSSLGLFIDESQNGALESPTKNYCLYETEAPAGYVKGAVQTVTIGSGAGTSTSITYQNTAKDNLPDLPLTGASGTIAMTVAGVALIAVGGLGILAVRRRRQD